jgi:hypothetical protein
MAKAPGEGSVLERIRWLDEERRQLMDAAVSEAMEKANEAIEALKSLGRHFRLVEGEPRRRSTDGEGGRKGTRQIDASKPCSICGFQTQPPHDARAHRSQQPKRPFSEEELRAKGMRKADQ